MFWKILLILLILLLAALFVLLLIPVSLRVSYEDGELRVRLRYASWSIGLFPSEKKKLEPESGNKAGETPKEKKQKEPRQKSKPNFEQLSYSLDVLPGVLIRALRRTARRIRVAPLKLHLLIALSDPADTAVLYGKLHGVLNATLPLLHRAVRIDDQDIQLFPDFTQDRMDCIADIGVKIRPFDILVIAILAAGGVIKWYMGYKKRADKTVPARKQQTTAPADPAA